MHATALIADDEPLLREHLQQQLFQCWPELRVVAQARNGIEALEQFECLHPDICFLDVHMPGRSGVEVAQQIGGRAHLVFVTAFDRYGLQAFEHGVLDYLVKPVQGPRLLATIARLRERLAAAKPALLDQQLLQRLAQQLLPPPAPAPIEPLRWLRVAIGNAVQLIAVDDIEYLRSDAKYTRVAWREGGRPAQALIRSALKDLLPQLDPQRFQQIHRAVVVNLGAIQRVVRGDHDTAEVFLKQRPEVLPVSRSYLHLFKVE